MAARNWAAPRIALFADSGFAVLFKQVIKPHALIRPNHPKEITLLY